MIKGYETTVKRNLEKQGVRLVDDLFTERNLRALAAFYNAANNYKGSPKGDLPLLGLNAILLAMSRMQGYVEDPRFPNQLMRGTYYLPQVSREYNVSTWLTGKLANLLLGIMKIQEQRRSTDLLISTQSATDLPGMLPETIDYIFTDPPYGSNVQYGELNFVWEAWLGFDTHWHDQEIIVNETRGMTDADWARLMRQAMSECYRVLKPGRWLSLCYHDTSEGTWQLVQDIMAELGFIAESGSGDTLYIDTGQKSYNQLMADKVTKRDLVINFRKPRLGEVAPALAITGDEDAATFAEKARAILVDALERHPGASADRLYDELVSRMVRRGEFERHNFEALLAQVAEPVREPVMRNLLDPTPPDLFGGHEVVRWYLKDSADHLDEAESRKEAAAAARLEKFMVAALTLDPSLPPRSGVSQAWARGEGRRRPLLRSLRAVPPHCGQAPSPAGRLAAGVLHQDAGRYVASAGGRR